MPQTNALEPCRPPADLAGVRGLMDSGQSLQDLAEIFKLLGDHTRVRILQALSLSDLCVCSLAELLSMSPSAVSHQLRILRAAKVVKFRKDGKHIYYSLDDPHVANLMREGLEHVQEGKG
jgi:ArsR family transcriptional regulator